MRAIKYGCKILPLVKVPRNSHQQAPKDFRYWNDQCGMGKYEMIMKIKELKTILKSSDDISCSKNPKKEESQTCIQSQYWTKTKTTKPTANQTSNKTTKTLTRIPNI